jgi:hypothetical protein
MITWHFGRAKMSTISETIRGTALHLDRSPVSARGSFRKLFASIFSLSKPARHQPQRHLQRGFHDYLDGYFNSFDFYPVCTRQVFVRNDAFALWQDFMKVAGDFSRASEQLVISPEKYLKLGAISNEKLEKRKRQAAKSSIRRVIQATKAKN